MNDTDIKPALTEKEWASAFDGWSCGVVRLFGGQTVSRHGLAAIALHDTPFGFTWEDVDFLERQAVSADASDYRGGDVEDFRALASRIAALLPPREPHPLQGAVYVQSRDGSYSVPVVFEKRELPACDCHAQLGEVHAAECRQRLAYWAHRGLTPPPRE